MQYIAPARSLSSLAQRECITMKKTALTILATATAFALVGCSQEAAEPEVEATEEAVVEAPVVEEPMVEATETPAVRRERGLFLCLICPKSILFSQVQHFSSHRKV